MDSRLNGQNNKFAMNNDKTSRNHNSENNPDLITITICSQALEDLHFKVKKNYPIIKVFDKYCKRMEIKD